MHGNVAKKPSLWIENRKNCNKNKNNNKIILYKAYCNCIVSCFLLEEHFCVQKKLNFDWVICFYFRVGVQIDLIFLIDSKA